MKLSQAFDELDSPGGTIVEPSDHPLDSRHLDMVYALLEFVARRRAELAD